MIRLNKYISNSGVCSRREADVLIAEGKIKYDETVTEGFENAPQGLRDDLSGKNFGKHVIKVAEE